MSLNFSSIQLARIALAELVSKLDFVNRAQPIRKRNLHLSVSNVNLPETGCRDCPVYGGGRAMAFISHVSSPTPLNLPRTFSTWYHERRIISSNGNQIKPRRVSTRALTPTPTQKLGGNGPLPLGGVSMQRRRRRRTRRRLNHFYVEPIECFHRDFASASKSASDATDASARNYNLDARVVCAIFRTWHHLDQRFLIFYSNFPTLANTKLLFPPFPSPTYLKMAIWWHHWHRFISITASLYCWKA